MFLRSLTMKNFRSCFDTTLTFQPSLTLLVGENNSGKSNVISALRLATVPLSKRRTRYFELEDVSYNRTDPIELITEFDGLTDIQQGHCITALDFATSRAWYSTRFTPNITSPRRSLIELFAGKAPSPDPEPEKREQINHVYLAPLRDAQRELDSASGNRLALVLQHLFSPEERYALLNEADQQYQQLARHAVVTGTRDHLQTHLSDLTSALREQQIGIGFTDASLNRLASALRIKMADAGFTLSDIAQSGLGYANLLFMATVILELRHAEESELTLFLVEEPEAHLHPQLQAVLLDYLQEQADRSARDDQGGPAGRIQIIATTHSPNLASAMGTEGVVVLRSVEQRIDPGESSVMLSRKTVALSLSDVPLQPDERRKIDQYLDVTRAELLFARRVILVEGIAEAVLLPVLASCCVYGSDSSEHRERRRTFRGISIINIGSVDFAPYVKLLLHQHEGVSLVDRLVVITDSDPAVDGQETKHDEDEPDNEVRSGSGDVKSSGEYRVERLTDLAEGLGSADVFTTVRSRFTLEADLLEPFDDNVVLMKSAFLKHKPNSSQFWTTVEESEDPSATFFSKMQGTNAFLRKGEFAHEVAQLIRSGHPYTCPPYLHKAITDVLRGR